MFYGPQHRTIVLATPSSCCLQHSSISQDWELCSGIAQATLHISHPKPANMLSHSELMYFPDEIQYMAEKGTFCPFQCLLFSFGSQLLLQCKAEAFPLPLLPCWSIPCEFIPGFISYWQKIFVPKHENLSRVLCLSILRLIYKSNGLHSVTLPWRSYTYVNP